MINGRYLGAAALSLISHGVFFLLLSFTGWFCMPPSPVSPPIEVEIEPSKLVSMGSGKLTLTPGSAPPSGPKRAARPRVRMAAVTPDQKPTALDPAPAKAPTSIDDPLPLSPGKHMRPPSPYRTQGTGSPRVVVPAPVPAEVSPAGEEKPASGAAQQVPAQEKGKEAGRVEGATGLPATISVPFRDTPHLRKRKAAKGQ
ncbi:MAG: hypothetical protein A4E57_03563 [Syntrophorhabdaceae bacterium PtaU1.Bin034]|nr:MAG: hypothetical protein A4E57_03563 [Syntrophorhabdaceae bacterium PtaU1.Bin034]